MAHCSITGNLRCRIEAALLHLLLSAGFALITAGLVFRLWYPGAYRLLSGGQELFLLVISVDVILGPLLTLVVFNVAKARTRLHFDLAMIALVQLTALAYGLHTVYVARPIAMVFEVDRFRVLTMDQVVLTELPLAPPCYRELPLAGPWLLGTRRPEAGMERSDALFIAAVGGVDIGQRPSFWQPYAASAADAVARSRPLAVLLQRYPERAEKLLEHVRELGVDLDIASYVPVIARGDWVAIVDKTGSVLGFLPVDGFT